MLNVELCWTHQYIVKETIFSISLTEWLADWLADWIDNINTQKSRMYHRNMLKLNTNESISLYSNMFIQMNLIITSLK